MANNGYRIGALAAVTIVALRLLIGWHFLTAGLEKLEPTWSSYGYLRSANGPFADFYKSMAPLPHEWDVLVTESWPESGEFSKARAEKGYVPLPTKAYGPWAERVAEDWTDTVGRFKKTKGLEEKQREAADKVLEERLKRLSTWFEDRRGIFDEYHHELDRLREMKKEAAVGTELPYLTKRIQKKEVEVEAIPRPWVADIQSEEHLLYDDLRSLVTEEQRESASLQKSLAAAFYPPTQLDTIDWAVTCLTLGVGVCLILGLFTRLAAIAGGGFLLSVMATQPPWADGVLGIVAQLFAYQGIEFVAMLLLAAIGAGRWAGLDGLLFRRGED